MSKYIYLVGKPYPQKSAINKIREKGYSVGLFHDTNQSLNNPELFDRIVKINFDDLNNIYLQLDAYTDLQVDGLVCIYENYVLAKSVFGSYFGLPTATIQSAKQCTDKFLMRKAFMDADPSITPHFALVSTQEELLAFSKQFSYPLIIKPTNLVKSLLVLTCSNESELLENFQYAKRTINDLYKKYNIYDREPQLIVEEFISGKMCSIAAFVDQNGNPHFCSGVASLTTAQNLGIDDNYLYSRHLPAAFEPDLEARLFDVAAKGIKALDMRSIPAHVELMFNETEVKLIEIGARIGGYRPRMYQLCYGIDMVEQEIRLATGEPLDLDGTFGSYCGVFELFPKSEGVFESIEGSIDRENYEYFSVKAKENQTIGPAKNGYKAAAIIIAASEDYSKYTELCTQIDSLKIRTKS